MSLTKKAEISGKLWFLTQKAENPIKFQYFSEIPAFLETGSKTNPRQCFLVVLGSEIHENHKIYKISPNYAKISELLAFSIKYK